jgi:CRISPR-associated protein Csm5
MKNQSANGRIECRLQVLTPVHVGCDDVYEPTGFVVDEGKDRLIVFDPTNFIQGLDEDEREQFSTICKKGTIESIIEVYRFMQNRPAEGRTVNLCRGFSDEYRRVLKLSPRDARTQLNRFEIKRTAFCPSDNRPYIPGSAIKGALRTAYLNALAQKGPADRLDLPQGRDRRPGRDDRHKALESKLLSLDKVQPKDRISQDPFRMVKVSDFMPVGKSETKIMYAVNWKKSPSGGEGRGPYQILEVVMPGTSFVGEIRVDTPQTKYAVSMAFDLKGIIAGCRLFFENENQREANELRRVGCKTPTPAGNDGAFPFRVGFHSGAECVTIEGYREIWIKGKTGGRTSDHATTVWLASEYDRPKHPDFLVPFGWTDMEPLSPEAMNALMEQEIAYKKERDRGLRQATEAARARLEKEAEEAERLERMKAEAEAQKEAEEKRKADFEAMSPEEKAIAELDAGDIIEHRVVEIFGQLQDFSEPYKTRAAQALKNYWQKEGKWVKKNCSKKQWEKVQKIKNILGE